MTDWESSPAITFSPHRVAEVFYEMHTLCENELDLSMRQRNLVSLGYLLYSNPDNILLITTLKWVSPELIIEVHKLMLKVCEQALLTIAELRKPLSRQTLLDYDQVMRLIRQKTRILEANHE